VKRGQAKEERKKWTAEIKETDENAVRKYFGRSKEKQYILFIEGSEPSNSE
jgi:hypothetical protein